MSTVDCVTSADGSKEQPHLNDALDPLENTAKNETSTESSTKEISKRQLKKMKKHERWIATKAERKQREKDKRKAKLAKLKESGEEIVSRKQIRHQLVRQADSPCKVSIVIDCDYADYMNELELKKLCKQLNRCYAMNKHSTKPAQLYITSVTGAVKDSLEKYQLGFQNWAAHCTEKHWTELFPSSSDGSNQSAVPHPVVYLSGDSSEVLPDCKDIQEANNEVFIIGGLIDHNRHKGLALERAQKLSVKHAQLPIGEHIKMCQRRILAIPHVFEIMLYAANGNIGQSWNDIFQKVIPNRKLVQDKAPDE